MPRPTPPRKSVGKTAVARAAHADFLRRFGVAQGEIRRTTSLTILVWGPKPRARGLVARKRRDIRSALRAIGHNALFSEEIPTTVGRSLKSLEFEQAMAADLIIVLVEGAPGASTEVADFCNHPQLYQKFLVMVPIRYKKGYLMNGAIQELDAATGGGCVYRYDQRDLKSCRLLEKAIERAEGVRAIYYRFQRGISHYEYR